MVSGIASPSPGPACRSALVGIPLVLVNGGRSPCHRRVGAFPKHRGLKPEQGGGTRLGSLMGPSDPLRPVSNMGLSKAPRTLVYHEPSRSHRIDLAL